MRACWCICSSSAPATSSASMAGSPSSIRSSTLRHCAGWWPPSDARLSRSRKEKPRGFWPRGLSFAGSPRRSKVIVDAAAHDVGGERYVVGYEQSAGQAAVELAEVDKQIFGLGAPVLGERELDAAAGRPAGIGGVGADEARGRGADIAERGAGGDEGHDAVRGIAEPAAHGGEPVVAGLAAEWTGHRIGGAVDVGPVDVALDADDALAELIVVAHGAADQAAGGVEAAGRVPLRAAEAAAAVDADVEAGPVINRKGSRSLVVGHRCLTRRKIGRRRRARQCRQADQGEKYALHYGPPLSVGGRIVFAGFFASSAGKPQWICLSRRQYGKI